MTNYYLGVCTSGHLIDSEKAQNVTAQKFDINSKIDAQKLANPNYTVAYDYCPDCGGEVLTACPECRANLKVEYEGPPYPGSDSIPSFCHGCGESFPWVSTVEAEKQREGDFIEIDDSEIDGQFYPGLVYEINLCYRVKADHAVLVLNRKLIESLTIDILRSVFTVDEIDLWFDTDEGITRPLSTLIGHLKSRSDELKKYGPTLDEPFFRAVEDLKHRGDASAHAIEEDLSQVDMGSKSELATTVAKTLFRLRKEAKTAHRR